MFQIFLTALITIIGGAVTYSVGQIIIRGAFDPALELKRLIGTIAFDLDFYANKLFFGPEADQEWRNKFRTDACSLREKLRLIVGYRIFAWLCRLPPAVDVLLASAELIGHSNRSSRQGEWQNSRDVEIKRLLRIRDSMPRKRLSGWIRLGIVLSFFWAIASVVFYLAGIARYPSFLSNWLSPFYTWVDRAPVLEHGLEFTPIVPVFDGWGLLAFIFLPLLSGWLLLFVFPCLIRWVWKGFRQTTHGS